MLRRSCIHWLPFFASLLIMTAPDPGRSSISQAQTAPRQAGPTATTKSDSDSPELKPGAQIERELRAGEVHSYRIRLSLHDCVRMTVDQLEADLVLRLTDPDGRQIAEVDGAEQGPEPVTLMAQVSGVHYIKVQPVKKPAAPRRYRIRVLELRKTGLQDQNRVVAQRALTVAKRLADQGTAESLERALKKYEEAIRLWRAAGEPTGEAQALIGLGLVYFVQGENAKAEDPLSRTLSLWRTTGDRRGEARSFDLLGQICDNLGEKQKALEHYAHALTMRRAENDRWGEGQTLSNIGSVYDSLGEKQKALDHFHEALAIFQASRYRLEEANTLNNLGGVYDVLGDKRKALDYFTQSLPLVRAEGERRLEAYLLHNSGGIYADLGEKQKALEYFSQSLPLFQVIGDRRGEAYALDLLGTVYCDLGETQRALDYYTHSLKLMQALADRSGEGMALNNIGYVYDVLGDKQKASHYYSEAFKLGDTLDDPIMGAYILNNLALIQEDLGEKQKALSYYEQSISLSRKAAHPRSEAITLRNMADLYASLGNKEKARSHLAESLKLSRAIGDRNIEAAILHAEARFEREQDHLPDARRRIEEALEIAELLRTKVAARDLRTSYFATVKGFFDFYIDLLMELHRRNPSAGYDAAALHASERARARGLLETLTEAGADIRQGVDPALVKSERSLQQQINVTAQQQVRLLSGKHTEEEAALVRKEMDLLVAKFQDLQGQIRVSSPRYAALTQPVPLELAQIQKQILDENTVLLEYSLGERRSFIWAVTMNNVASHELPRRAEVESLARRFHGLLTARNLHIKKETPERRLARIAKAEAEYPEAASKLSWMLLGPVLDQLDAKRLLVVPEGILQYIPFGALPAPGPGIGEAQAAARVPLMLEHEIVSLPSASTLAVLRREMVGRKSAPGMLAVLADPVFDGEDPRVRKTGTGNRVASGHVPSQGPVKVERAVERAARESGVTQTGLPFPRLMFSRREAQWILGQAPAESRLQALGFAANRSTATSAALGQYRIVHIASHGIANSVHPELSGIVLSLVDERGRAQDGFLRLHEIYNLKLPAELVVLSSCQTALGKEIKGEGLVGLTRGFMYAGAERVIASLWQVDDEATATLMRHFYKAMLAEGMRPAEALRSAQMAIWKQRRWKSPYYWAAFILQGEYR